MQQTDVWITITKSKPLPGCEIDMDGCEYYFADAFVPLEPDAGATALVSVISRVTEALLEKKLELAEVLLCAKFSAEEWLDKTESIETLHQLANKAAAEGKIVFSGFRSEEIQALYHYKHTVQENDE